MSKNTEKIQGLHIQTEQKILNSKVKQCIKNLFNMGFKAINDIQC